MTTTSSPLLSIQELSIVLPSSGDRSYAVDRLTLDIAENEIVCLVGESGSGKSMTAHAILGLLPPRVKLDSQEPRAARRHRPDASSTRPACASCAASASPWCSRSR
jgi:ABC-type glutathione transport system ATPase component